MESGWKVAKSTNLGGNLVESYWKVAGSCAGVSFAGVLCAIDIYIYIYIYMKMAGWLGELI